MTKIDQNMTFSNSSQKKNNFLKYIIITRLNSINRKSKVEDDTGTVSLNT